MSAPRPGGPGAVAGMLSLQELDSEAQAGTVDTVVTAFTDMQGRLFGKRIDVGYFLDQVADHGVEGCNYLLALDMEMEPVPGYELANWEQGYGDFGIAPDLSTLRRVPWLDRTALVLCDVLNHDGSPVKPSEKDIGSSCHIHSRLVGTGDGRSVFVEGDEETDVFRHYLGGLRARIRELALFVAPSINSYKRYAAESWAPTSISWGRDNRTCGFRIVGHGQSRRVECRIPGADVNPYLGYAALLAAGLDGIERGSDPGPELVGNAYEAAGAEAFPSSLREAVELWEGSDFARAAFGEEVWRHYLNYGRTEQRLFDQVVTDYERRRMFERG